jgi:chromosome segregation ATPase
MKGVSDMADTTWAVRVDEQTKQEVIELLNSSGDQGKEFLISMMTAYKLKKAEEMQPLASQDLKELQIHINRIQDIYYNLSQRVETRLAAKDQEIEEILNKKNADLDAALNRINELQGNIQEIKSELDCSQKVVGEQAKKIVEMEEANSTTKALVAEYKDKNDMLAGLLAEYKGFKASIEEIKKELEQEKDARVKADKAKVEALGTIDRLKELHKDDLQKVKDSAAMECKQTMLDIQAKHQEEINKLHQAYNSRMEELNAKLQELILSFKPQNEPARPETRKGKGKRTQVDESPKEGHPL